MSLFHAAYRTYESQSHRIGKTEEGQEPLTPISHIQQNAHIEITLDNQGVFVSAAPVDKTALKTIIPVTMASAGRTSGACPHPLSDQLCYLSPELDEKKFALYIKELEAWAQSPHSHPKVRAVWQYVKGGGIIQDLIQAEVVATDGQGRPHGQIAKTEVKKCLVRWRVMNESSFSHDCWRDASLFDSFIRYYAAQCAEVERDLCMVTGQMDMLCESHPKGTVAFSFGAKLISANDNQSFTYRGRFTQARQAGNVGYNSSQKAHSALRWLTANYGVAIGGRTFLCWNPEGVEIAAQDLLINNVGVVKNPGEFVSYQKEVKKTLAGYGQYLKDEDDVVIASLDAATTGRLSVTYFNQLKASDFLKRLEHWYKTFSWNYIGRESSPALRQVVGFAFGVQRDEKMETDDKVMREHIQRLLRCMVDGQALPYDIVRNLVNRAGRPQQYSRKNHRYLVNAACAALRKHLNNQTEEEWTLALDATCTNRSYLFGRLLATAEVAERSTYQIGSDGKSGADDKRESNAIKLMSVYTHQPMKAWEILRKRLIPYLRKMKPLDRKYFENRIDEIFALLDQDNPELNAPLEPVYLIGYSHQRSYLYTKKKIENEPNDVSVSLSDPDSDDE